MWNLWRRRVIQAIIVLMKVWNNSYIYNGLDNNKKALISQSSETLRLAGAGSFFETHEYIDVDLYM